VRSQDAKTKIYPSFYFFFENLEIFEERVLRVQPPNPTTPDLVLSAPVEKQESIWWVLLVAK